jgi:hypothetical protein
LTRSNKIVHIVGVLLAVASLEADRGTGVLPAARITTDAGL